MSDSQIIELNTTNILCKLIDVWAVNKSNDTKVNALYELNNTQKNWSGSRQSDLDELKEQAHRIAKSIHELNIEGDKKNE